MSTSDFPTVTGTDSAIKMPISIATGANGHTAVTHCAMISITGTATSVNESHLMSTVAAGLPLPAGFVPDASVAGVATMLNKISNKVSIDQAHRTQDATRINGVTAAAVSFAQLGGLKDLIPVAVGPHHIVGTFAAENGAATEAATTHANIK